MNRKHRATTARLLAGLAALLCVAPALAAKPEKRTIQYRGEERTYHLVVPDRPEGAGPMPLLLLLHGSGRDGMSLVDKWRKLAEQEGILLAAPNSHDSRVWAAPADGPDFLYEIVEELQRGLPVDPARVYLFGHSGGASFGLQMAISESEYFAAGAVHAGRLHPESYPMADMAPRKIPLLIVVGTRDASFPLDVVRETRDALQSRGFDVQLTEIQGHDHWYYDRAPKINEMCWEFLEAHRLDGEPKYIQYRFE